MNNLELIAPSFSPQKLRMKVLLSVEVVRSGIVDNRNHNEGGGEMRVHPVRSFSRSVS